MLKIKKQGNKKATVVITTVALSYLSGADQACTGST